MTTLRPFFPYYGSKWRAVPRYPEPTHDMIVEPFAGAAGYSTRNHERRVYLSDVDEFIVATWEYLISTPGDEIAALPLIDEFECTDDLDIPEGARCLIGYWLNPGSSGPCKRPSRWCRENQTAHPGSIWSERTRARVVEQVDHIRHWRTRRVSYVDLHNVEATYFVDPPYIEAGSHYRHGSKTLDYTRVAQWCRSRRGQVIVCENAGASWLPFESIGSIKATAGRGRSGVSHEVAWLSPAVVDVEQEEAS